MYTYYVQYIVPTMSNKYIQMSVGFLPEDMEKLEIVSRKLGQSKGASVRSLVHFFLLNVVDIDRYKDDNN